MTKHFLAIDFVKTSFLLYPVGHPSFRSLQDHRLLIQLFAARLKRNMNRVDSPAGFLQV
jgi:hypothetical protein